MRRIVRRGVRSPKLQAAAATIPLSDTSETRVSCLKLRPRTWRISTLNS
ncbi:hypothetical protein [Baaleninema sp.]